MSFLSSLSRIFARRRRPANPAPPMPRPIEWRVAPCPTCGSGIEVRHESSSEQCSDCGEIFPAVMLLSASSKQLEHINDPCGYGFHCSICGGYFADHICQGCGSYL